jgi:hypothetical protein
LNRWVPGFERAFIAWIDVQKLKGGLCTGLKPVPFKASRGKCRNNAGSKCRNKSRSKGKGKMQVLRLR